MNSVLTAFLALSLFSGTADGQNDGLELIENDLVEVEYGAFFQVRYFRENDPEFTTSKCIGYPVTPLCAAETLKFRGGDLHLIARGKKPGIPDYSFPEPANPVAFCYRVMGYFHYTRLTVPKRKNPWDIKDGDVAVSLMPGYMVDGICDFSKMHAEVMSYLTRRGEYGWYVVNNDNRVDFVRDPYRVNFKN